MPITIKINDAEAAIEKKEPQASVSLKISKSLSGNLIISDHDYLDIIIDPTQHKIITLPNPQADKDVFSYQQDLFRHLFHKGLVENPAPEGGMSYGVVEASYTPSSDAEVDSVQSILYQLEKYLQMVDLQNSEAEEYDDNIEDRFTDPPPGEYTPYGSVPPYQDTPQGSQDSYNPAYAYAGYGYLY